LLAIISSGGALAFQGALRSSENAAVVTGAVAPDGSHERHLLREQTSNMVSKYSTQAAPQTLRLLRPK
jgi:hypothetical protein